MATKPIKETATVQDDPTKAEIPVPEPTILGRAAKAFEPTFVDATTDLAEADAKARSADADAKQSKAARSTAAVGAIRAAFSELMPPGDVRTALIKAGVLKGTVSKIVTVLTSLQKREVAMSDVKSLNGAYNLVKSVHAVASIPPAPAPAPAPAPVTTPDEALKLIIGVIKAEKDPVKALALAGEWITKITNGIMEAAKEVEDDEE